MSVFIKILFFSYINFFVLFLAFGENSDKNHEEKKKAYSIYVQKSTAEISIDGVLDEETWQKAQRGGQFVKNFPIDEGSAGSPTEFMISYDDDFLYLAAICYEPDAAKPIVESLRRDYDWARNDNVSFYIDPYNDKTNGFMFGVTALGVQREGLVFNGRDVSQDWDNKWYSAVKQYEDRWQVEIKVPFKSIRYNDEIEHWNINVARNDLKKNERTVWAPVPVQYSVSSFGYAGQMIWDAHLPEPKANWAFIPYLAGGAVQMNQSGLPTDYQWNAGLDAKVALNSSLNLDLTVNPDFSQVEVDQQVTNLSRFELFFPERRQFFLENSDLFGNFGFGTLRPFFTRRIGLNSPVIAGARLSGKINEDWRIGAMNVTTGMGEDFRGEAILPQNFSVAAVQKKVFSRSNIGAILVNRENLILNSDLSQSEMEEMTGFTRVAGVDYNLASADDKWVGKAFVHKAFTPGNNEGNHVAAGYIRRNSRNFNTYVSYHNVGEGYQPDVGFVPRSGYHRFSNSMYFSFYPKLAWINQHGPRMYNTAYFDRDFDYTDRFSALGYWIQFANTSALYMSFNDNYVKLFNDFDPTNTGGTPLLRGEDFNWQSMQLWYSSDSRQVLSYSLQAEAGGFYSGDRQMLGASLNYRIQPIANISLNANFNNIQMSEDYTSASFWLIGPRLDFTFTDKLFLTTFVQYNEQIENVNINTRLQWRFKPVSDLFVVYTDNYMPESFLSKNRAIMLKVSYWINV